MNDHLSDSAQRQLAALRKAVESRLAALEEVLADPTRSESLAGLILDLSRVATDEAQAAASQACLATKAEADKQIAEVRASTQAALDSAQAALKSAHAAEVKQERAIGSDLRRAVEQAEQEIHKQAELLTAREQLEAELRSARERLEAEIVRQQALAADRQRAAAEAQQQLEAERRSNDELRRLAERADTRLATLGREQAEARAAREAVVAELAREREAVAGLKRASAEVQSQLEAERASGAELRRAAERGEELAATFGRATSQGRAAHEDLAADLARQQEGAALLQKALAEAQSELEAERESNADLRLAIEQADQRLSSTRSDQVQTLADLERLAGLLAHERAETAKAPTATADAQRELASARTETQALRADLDVARTRLEALAAERDTVAGALQAARRWIDELREAETEFAVPAPPVGTGSAAAPPHTPPPKQVVDAPASSSADEGWQGVRLASRYVFREEIAVQINGGPGMLSDLSISGCQLLSPTALKPNHLVKVQLPSGQTSIKCTGKVVWTRLEPSAAGRPLCYRAGVRFTKADESAIEAFVAHHDAKARS